MMGSQRGEDSSESRVSTYPKLLSYVCNVTSPFRTGLRSAEANALGLKLQPYRCKPPAPVTALSLEESVPRADCRSVR